MPETRRAAPDNGSGHNADHADQAGESHNTVPAALKPASKFDWLEQVLARTELSGSVKTVAARIAIKSVGSGTAMAFRVRQSTLAIHCGMGERSVQRAFAELRDSGWIELVELRGARGIGHHQADQYRLALPSHLPANLAGNSDDLPANTDATYPPKMADLPAKTDTPTRQLGGTYPPKLVTGDALTSTDDPPKGLKKVSSKGLERGLAAGCADAAPAPMPSPEEEQQADDDPEPPLFCSKHMPNGIEEDCGPCGTRREARKAWKKRHPEVDAEPAPPKPVSTLNPDCRICGGFGDVLGDDSTPIEPAVKCPLCRPHKASADNAAVAQAVTR